jgi:hypothetical protein
MAERDTPASDNPGSRTPAYHAVLLEAFLAGSSVGDAARQAGISRRQCQRWRGRYWHLVQEARQEALDGLVARVRRALPVALDRLENTARAGEDEGTAVRAAMGLFEVFGKVSERVELDQRLAWIEERLNAPAVRQALAAVRVPAEPARLIGVVDGTEATA